MQMKERTVMNMKNWIELQQREEWRQEVSIFAVLYERGPQWSKAAAVARNAGVSLPDTKSVLKKMRAAKVIEAERRGQRLGYRTLGARPSDYRTALIQEARRLKLIQGPQMRPLFADSQSSGTT